MTTPEERLRILKMIEEGKVSAEDGARLLEALTSRDQRQTESGTQTVSPRWFRVRVTDLNTGKHKVNVNIPMGLVNVGMKMGARFAPDIEGVDLAQVSELISAGVTGKIMEVEDAEDGERVEIFVE